MAVTRWAGRGRGRAVEAWREHRSVLATARRQAGLTITQVSERTCIREGMVRGIEADDFSAAAQILRTRAHPRHRRQRGHRPRAAGRGVRLQPRRSPPCAPPAGPGHRPPAAQPAPPAALGWSVALLAVLAALAGLVTYHFVAAGPAGSSPAAARTPAATAHKAARKHPAAKTTAAPPAKAHARAVVISVTAVSEPCWADLTTPGGATIFEGIVGTGTSKTWTERQAVT